MEPYLIPSRIHDRLAPLVANNSSQTPRSEPLRGAGDEGGQFVFRLITSTPGLTHNNSSKEALSKSERELKTLEELERQFAEQARLKELQAQIEKKREKMEMAKAYALPKSTGKEITGQDGAPMVLVPEGNFEFGDDRERNRQQLWLPEFYMDKYEVTVKLFSRFIQVTGHSEPHEWAQQLIVRDSENRPAVNVNWYDAHDYCRHYGKRLPTEEEWEKAARGLDGRKYPWGNEKPTVEYANFDEEWRGYQSLALVGTHRAGASQYGIQDLAGNVWEWTSSDSVGGGTVIRGGSLIDEPLKIRSAYRWKFNQALLRKGTLGFRCVQGAS